MTVSNNGFLSDLNQINFQEDLTQFFTNPENQIIAKERMKLFFSKYHEFVTGIKLYDNNKNEFTLKKDTESEGEWLEQPFILHDQAEIYQQGKTGSGQTGNSIITCLYLKTMKQSEILLLQLIIRNISKKFSRYSILRIINGNGLSVIREKLFTTIMRKD